MTAKSQLPADAHCRLNTTTGAATLVWCRDGVHMEPDDVWERYVLASSQLGERIELLSVDLTKTRADLAKAINSNRLLADETHRLREQRDAIWADPFAGPERAHFEAERTELAEWRKVKAWALCAIDAHGNGIVVDCHREFRNITEMSGIPKEFGLWSWEGEIQYCDDDTEVSRGTWRRASAAEVIALAQGRRREVTGG